jgi:hypothetical protein
MQIGKKLKILQLYNRFLTIMYFFPNYKGLGTPIVIFATGNNLFHVHFIYIFHRINLSSLVEKFLKVVAKNAAQGVRHK